MALLCSRRADRSRPRWPRAHHGMPRSGGARSPIGISVVPARERASVTPECCRILGNKTGFSCVFVRDPSRSLVMWDP